MTTQPALGVRLTRDAAVALLKEAREQFENGACELYNSDDDSQHRTIAACVEIIGRIGSLIDHPWGDRTETPPTARRRSRLPPSG